MPDDTEAQELIGYFDEAPVTVAPAVNSQIPAKPRKPTDDELRDRWLAGVPLTAHGLGEWRRYGDGSGVWDCVSEEQIAAEIVKVLEAAKVEGVKPSTHCLSSVMELARLKVYKEEGAWDSDPDLVICKNGAFHIPTMTLWRHKPIYHATSSLNFNYNPEATAPTWEYFLKSTIPNAANLLQEYFGYCLTTDTRHEMALWLQGVRGSGKSTCVEGATAVLGDRATVLGLSDIERSRFSLWNLRGKTLAVASEQPALFIQSSHILNALISGELLPIERKFKDSIVIRSHVKIIWAMNELPRVSDAGNGLFRRVKVIKFPPLPEEKRDPEVKEKIKTEGAGILNWALEGLRRLRERGKFEIPACVQDATAHFQETNDVAAVFVAECCLTGEDYKAKSSLLYEKYSAWCFANGHKPKSSTAIADDWERLGFEKRKEMVGNYWHGVGIQVENE